jgi:hypothetical protein
VVRVGGASAPGDSKVAVVAARERLLGRRFTVRDRRGRVVLRGRLARAAGTALPWPHAARADITRLRRPGRYVVRVGRLRSRPWYVDRSARSKLVRRLLRLYAVNSDGAERNPVFGSAHMNDAVVSGGRYDGQRFDLTGGWRDAGDNLKFTLDTSFAVICLELAARLDRADARRLRAASDVGVRWLVKAHPRPDLFIGQVGDLRDHETGFRDPAGDDRSGIPGIAQRLAFPSTGSNHAGLAAAALALAARRSSGARRTELLGQARAWYDAGKAAAATSPPLGGFAYDMPWEDHMAVGAAYLYRATGDRALLADAVGYLRRSELTAGLTSFDVAPLAAAELCGGLAAPAVTSAPARAVACGGLRTAAGAAFERARATAFASPGPFAFGFANDNGGSGAVAAAAARAGVARRGRAVAAGARDYLLGRNPWGASFLVGPRSREAHHPHHPAFLKGSPSRLLNGAVVGGPATPRTIEGQGLELDPRDRFAAFDSPLAVYEDHRDDYVTSEVDLTYSSESILLAALLR